MGISFESYLSIDSTGLHKTKQNTKNALTFLYVTHRKALGLFSVPGLRGELYVVQR